METMSRHDRRGRCPRGAPLVALAALAWLGALAPAWGAAGGGAAPEGAGRDGVVAGPYIVGAVFEEVSAVGDRVLQTGSSPSDAAGRFRFPRPLQPGSLVRMRPDGMGVQVDTPCRGVLKRRVNAGDEVVVVSPLTTLLANGVSAEVLLEVLRGAGLGGLAPADLTRDPMDGVTTLSNRSMAPERIALLQAVMAADTFMDAIGDYDVDAAGLVRPERLALLRHIAAGVRATLNSVVYEQVSATVVGGAESQVRPEDLVQAAVHVNRYIADRVKDARATPGSAAGSVVAEAVRESLVVVPAIAREYYEERIGLVEPDRPHEVCPKQGALLGGEADRAHACVDPLLMGLPRGRWD